MKEKKMNAHRLQRFKDNFELSLLLIPGILFFIVFSYLPMVGTIIAFKDYRNNLGIFGSKWVGLQNFRFFFTSQDAWRITRNTVGYGLLFIVLGIVTSVIIAIMLYEVHKKYLLNISNLNDTSSLFVMGYRRLHNLHNFGA